MCWCTASNSPPIPAPNPSPYSWTRARLSSCIALGSSSLVADTVSFLVIARRFKVVDSPYPSFRKPVCHTLARSPINIWNSPTLPQLQPVSSFQAPTAHIRHLQIHRPLPFPYAASPAVKVDLEGLADRYKVRRPMRMSVMSCLLPRSRSVSPWSRDDLRSARTDLFARSDTTLSSASAARASPAASLEILWNGAGLADRNERPDCERVVFKLQPKSTKPDEGEFTSGASTPAIRM